jgi:hypothetical protein
MHRYIQDNFDTGFLSPYFNFALTLAGIAFALAVIVWRLSCLQ